MLQFEKDELYLNADFIALPPYELHITRLFFQNLNKTLSKELLLNTLSEGNEMSEGALRVHINKLRNIGLPINTVKGIGYRLASLWKKGLFKVFFNLFFKCS